MYMCAVAICCLTGMVCVHQLSVELASILVTGQFINLVRSCSYSYTCTQLYSYTYTR
jgi:hypothetical protein